MIKMTRRRFLFLWFTSLILISLPGTALAQSAKITENELVQKELDQMDWAMGNDVKMCPVSPVDGRWNGPVFADIKEADNLSSVNPSMDSASDVVFQNWRGFALKGNESHAIRVSIESIRPVEAMSIRKLMETNMTLEEIRTEIRKEEGDVIHRGVLRISGDVFKLIDIEMNISGNKTILDANVSELKFGPIQNNTTLTTGHLNVALSGEDGNEISQGTLKMDNGKYIGNIRCFSILSCGSQRQEARELNQ